MFSVFTGFGLGPRQVTYVEIQLIVFSTIFDAMEAYPFNYSSALPASNEFNMQGIWSV